MKDIWVGTFDFLMCCVDIPASACMRASVSVCVCVKPSYECKFFFVVEKYKLKICFHIMQVECKYNFCRNYFKSRILEMAINLHILYENIFGMFLLNDSKIVSGRSVSHYSLLRYLPGLTFHHLRSFILVIHFFIQFFIVFFLWTWNISVIGSVVLIMNRELYQIFKGWTAIVTFYTSGSRASALSSASRNISPLIF
jgi:hypothetical protein